jgi:hypothetical protein
MRRFIHCTLILTLRQRISQRTLCGEQGLFQTGHWYDSLLRPAQPKSSGTIIPEARAVLAGLPQRIRLS